MVGNVAFGAGLVLVLTTTILGGFGGVALLLELADRAFLSSVVPDDGRGAVVIGGIAFGAVTGGFVPALLIGMVHGTETKPRVRPGKAARNVAALLAFDVYVVVLAVLVSQLGRLLPEQLTTLVGVFAIGFSWMPLALLPREKFGS